MNVHRISALALCVVAAWLAPGVAWAQPLVPRPTHLFAAHTTEHADRTDFLAERHVRTLATATAHHVVRAACCDLAPKLARQHGVLDRALDASSQGVADAVAEANAFERPAVGFAERRGALPSPIADAQPTALFAPRAREQSATAVRHTGWTYVVEPGAQARAVADGVVTFAAPVEGLGIVVLVDHGGGFHSVYGHLLEANVDPGVHVATGQPVGRAGHRSAFDEHELYFELRQDGVPLDPAEWMEGATPQTR